MQDFKIINENEYMSDSLSPLMKNDQTLLTNNSGPDYPVNMVQGSLYYRPQLDEDGRVIGKGQLYLCYNSDVQKAEQGYALISDLNIELSKKSDLTNHVNSITNPHKVTASQVNCYDKPATDKIVNTLAKKDLSNINLQSFPKFKGATAQSNGQTGMLEGPQKEDATKFLCGNGQWITIKQGFEGFPIGFRMDWDGDILPRGWVEEVGQILNRSDYPEAWQFMTQYGMVVTDTEWINNQLHGKFSSGNGQSTFRMPDRRQAFVKYDNNNIGKLINEHWNHFTEVQTGVGRGWYGKVAVPQDGQWSDWVGTGEMGKGIASAQFRMSGGGNYPKHIITRSIRKMK